MADRVLTQLQKTVSTAGTAEAISATKLLVSSLVITGLSANTGNLFIGDSSIDSSSKAYAADEGASWSSDNNVGAINLAEQYLDVSVNGEGADILYLPAE